MKINKHLLISFLYAGADRNFFIDNTEEIHSFNVNILKKVNILALALFAVFDAIGLSTKFLDNLGLIYLTFFCLQLILTVFTYLLEKTKKQYQYFFISLYAHITELRHSFSTYR